MIAEKAVVAGNSLGYDGPADWYPPPETLGSADLRGGRLIEARKTFWEDLGHNRILAVGASVSGRTERCIHDRL